jgi:hypothetical protein
MVKLIVHIKCKTEMIKSKLKLVYFMNLIINIYELVDFYCVLSPLFFIKIINYIYETRSNNV